MLYNHLQLQLQILPKTDSENKFYSKDINYDKEVKDKINRNDSLIRNGATDYINGNVQVIIPCSETKF